MTALKLPTRPYCIGCDEQNLSKIVDEQGENAGMTTLIDAMVHATPASVEYALGVEVTRLIPSVVGFTLVLSNGTEVSVESLLLAMPQQPLLKLLHSSTDLKLSSEADGLNNFRSLHRIRASPAMKLYVLYEDAWWRNELNLTTGAFNNSAAPELQTSGTPVPQFPSLVGRYHDGDVRCDPHCRGFLETTYTFDDVSLAFFRPYRRGAAPYVLLGDTPHDIAGTDLLEAVHMELVHYHKPALLARGPAVFARTMSLRPSMGVLAIWDEATVGFGGAIHDWMRDDRGNATCASFEGCQQIMPERLMHPFPKLPLFIAGEAFGARNGWTESALAMVENVLFHHFGLRRPAWIDPDTYSKKVLYNITRSDPREAEVVV